jgi:hypothetical protein
MKFRVRDDDKKEFEVYDVQEIEARTKSFLAKATIIAGLLILVLTAAYFAVSGNGGELKTIVNCTMPLLGFVLGHYFRSPNG